MRRRSTTLGAPLATAGPWRRRAALLGLTMATLSCRAVATAPSAADFDSIGDYQLSSPRRVLAGATAAVSNVGGGGGGHSQHRRIEQGPDDVDAGGGGDGRKDLDVRIVITSEGELETLGDAADDMGSPPGRGGTGLDSGSDSLKNATDPTTTAGLVRVMARVDSADGRRAVRAAAAAAGGAVHHEIYPVTATVDGTEAESLPDDDDDAATAAGAAEILAFEMAEADVDTLRGMAGVVAVERDAAVRALTMRPGWEDVFTVRTERKKKDDATGEKKKGGTKGKRGRDKDMEEDDKDRGRGDKKGEQDIEKDDDEEGGDAQQRARHRQRRLSAFEDGEIIPPGIKLVQADRVPVGPYAPQVCLVDTGYGLGHRDLPHEKGRTVMGRSPEDTDDDDDYEEREWSDDGNGHGTHNAGVVAAVRDNGLGVRGVLAFNSDHALRAPGNDGHPDLFVVPALDDNGEGYMSDVLAAVRHCVAGGANVISLGMGCSVAASDDPDDANPDCDSSIAEYFLDRTVTSFGDVMIVAPAGNDAEIESSQSKSAGGGGPRGSEHYPASFDSVVSVTAVAQDVDADADSDNSVATLVPAPFAVLNAAVDLAGPGVDVFSTYKFPNGTNGFASLSGTSHAASHVAGAAALIWSYHPRCGAQDVWDALFQTALEVKDVDVVGQEQEGGSNSNSSTVDGARLVQIKDALEVLNQMECAGMTDGAINTDATTPATFQERGTNDADGPWTACEGTTVDECLFIIRDAGFKRDVVKVEKDAVVEHAAYDENRVRIMYDEEDIVRNAPYIG